MINDGLFTVHIIPVYVELNKPITILPFGCIHRHTELCNVEAWHSALDKMRKIKHCYYLGMGDYEDFISASERRAMFNGNLHESTEGSLYDFADTLTKELYQELAFMKGRVLGLLSGNHFMPYPNGVTSDQRLCEMLRCRYLGCTSVVVLQLMFGGAERKSFVIWAHHGVGGSARTPGGDINRVEQMREAMEADCYCMGHSHARGIMPMTKLEPVLHVGTPHVETKKQWLLRTGSFLNSYVNGKRSYIASDAKSPKDMGCVKLELTLKRRVKTDRRYYIESTGGYL